MQTPKLIERAGERVLTTAQLAEAYGTTPDEISVNFHRNKARFIDGKHFHIVDGDALRSLKRDLANCNLAIPKNVNRYYLWTERGALLHAKSLNTDTAWAVYDFLVENYFRKKEQPQIAEKPEQVKQKEIAKHLLHYRKLQTQTAIKEADARCARAEEMEYLILHPELMPYANLLTAAE